MREEGRDEGRIAATQRLLLRLGTKRFGPPDTKIISAIEAIRGIDRLEALAERLLGPVWDWPELLQNP
ncbi:MAG: hypothetical protein ACP5XB_25715 [Isosphaeraceae bacterium]